MSHLGTAVQPGGIAITRGAEIKDPNDYLKATSRFMTLMPTVDVPILAIGGKGDIQCPTPAIWRTLQVGHARASMDAIIDSHSVPPPIHTAFIHAGLGQ